MKVIASSIKPRMAASVEKDPLFGDLHQQAFDNSLRANIIFTVSDGRIISANRAACKLLGYSKKELLTKCRKDIFSKSDGRYKKMLRQRNMEGSVKADLALIKKSGKGVPCEITSVIFRNKNGVDQSILSIVDLSERLSKQKKIDIENEKVVAGNIVIAQAKSDSSQAENNDWIKSIARTSYDVIWDWDIIANVICFGNSFEKVFGYKLPKNTVRFDEWMDFIRPEERDNVGKKITKIIGSKGN